MDKEGMCVFFYLPRMAFVPYIPRTELFPRGSIFALINLTVGYSRINQSITCKYILLPYTPTYQQVLHLFILKPIRARPHIVPAYLPTSTHSPVRVPHQNREAVALEWSGVVCRIVWVSVTAHPGPVPTKATGQQGTSQVHRASRPNFFYLSLWVAVFPDPIRGFFIFSNLYSFFPGNLPWCFESFKLGFLGLW